MALREFSSVKVGDELPEKIIKLTRQDLVNYAGVSGDLNPIHWDDEIAQQVGLDTAIAHGMLTMGRALRVVTDWVGDPGRVRAYSVRFTKPVAVPDTDEGATVLVTGRVTALADGVATVAIDAVCDGVKVLGSAVAEVRVD